jgi:NADPH2:quinone reductase
MHQVIFMKAVSLHQAGSTEGFRLTEVPLPQPKDQEIRIRIRVSGFNPVDVKMRQGLYASTQFPVILGADCSGVVDAIGKGVQKFQVGDEVLAFVFGQGSNGTYAEYTCIHEYFVAKKPREISFEEAASLPLVGLTAYRALFSCKEPKGSAFIAGGSGGVGSIALQLAQELRMNPIFTTAGSEESQKYLIEHLKIPKENILLYRGLSQEKMQELLLEKNAKNLIANCFDFVGGEMKKLCFSCVDFHGHVSTILPEEKGFPFDVWDRKESLAFSKSLTIHFVFVGTEAFKGSPETWKAYQTELSYLIQLAANKKLKFPEIQCLDGLSVDHVKEAHASLEAGHTRGKIVMKVN